MKNQIIKVRAYDEETDQFEVWVSDVHALAEEAEDENGYIGKMDAVILGNLTAEGYDDPTDYVGKTFTFEMKLL